MNLRDKNPSLPPSGELNVSPNRHWVTCSSKLGIGRFFVLSLALVCFTLFVLSLNLVLKFLQSFNVVYVSRSITTTLGCR